jgi:hypothetical protein
MPGPVPGIRAFKDLPSQGLCLRDSLPERLAVRRSGMTAERISRIPFRRAGDCELRNRALRTKSHTKTVMEAAT